MSEWGPWVEHDGRGYPCNALGKICEVYTIGFFQPLKKFGPLKVYGRKSDGGSWNWSNAPRCTRVIRYRIRKPRGMTILESIVTEPERELEDAE